MSAHPVADCHLHILDLARFAYDSNAPYLPASHETAPAVALAAVHAAHGVTHAPPDADACRAIQRETPAQLFGFAADG